MRGYSKAHIRKPKSSTDNGMNITPIVIIIIIIIMIIYVIITEGWK